MLTPSSNTVLEPMTMRICGAAPDGVSVHFSRFRVTNISSDPSSRHQFADLPMLEAARLLADAKVDVIVWNGTSGGWEGLDRDRELVRAIEAETGTPATTGTLAAVDALGLLGARRYGLVVPYVDEITASIRETFSGAGFECVASTNEGIVENWDFARLEPTTIADRCRKVAKANPDAVLIFCTNLSGAPEVDLLERELHRPVVDSVVLCLWSAFHRLGSQALIPGYGTLLEKF